MGQTLKAAGDGRLALRLAEKSGRLQPMMIKSGYEKDVDNQLGHARVAAMRDAD